MADIQTKWEKSRQFFFYDFVLTVRPAERLLAPPGPFTSNFCFHDGIKKYNELCFKIFTPHFTGKIGKPYFIVKAFFTLWNKVFPLPGTFWGKIQKQITFLFSKSFGKQKSLVKYFDSITLKAPYLVILPLNGFLVL